MAWQNFLNLCICQESQLQHVETYRQVSRCAGLGRGPRRQGRAATGALGAEVPGERHRTRSHGGRQGTS